MTQSGSIFLNTLKYLVLLVLLALGFVHWILPGLVERSMNGVEAHAPYVIRPEVQKFHDSLFIADLHADSLLWKRNLAGRSNTGHIDFPRLREGNVALQVFSATTKSPKDLNYQRNTADSDDITMLAVLSFWPTETWSSLYARANYQLNSLKKYVQASSGSIRLIRTRADMSAFVDDRQKNPELVAAMYLIEGAHPLEGRLENLDALFEQGLRISGLTHFFDNELGGSLHGVSNQGLTDFGRAVIKRANELGVIIDVAHASPAMVRDVLELSTKPLVLSHGGVKGVCDQHRNLDDALMKKFAEKGGLLGVGFWDGAVCDATPNGVVKSIRYAIDLLGLEHVALGSDYDGSVDTHFDSSELAVLTQTMMDHGFSEREIRAVMGENVKQFLLENLPE